MLIKLGNSPGELAGSNLKSYREMVGSLRKKSSLVLKTISSTVQ